MLGRFLLHSVSALAFLDIGVGAATKAHAQSQIQLEEVVVTARKREESLLTVPISVSAVTAAQLQNANIKDFQDIARVTPSFYFSDQVGQLRADRSTRVYVMRGLSIATVATGEAVLIFLDGAPIVGMGDVGSFANIERVEVLRGPQAAYFGRSTYAGAVNVVTKTPSDTFGGQLDGEFARFGTVIAGAALEGPLVKDKLTARVTGRFEHKGGQYTNLADGTKLGERNTKQGTLQLAATPNDAFSLKGYFGFFEFDDGPDARGLFLIPQRPCVVPGAFRTWFCGAIPNFPTNQLGFNTVIDQRFRDNVFPRSIFGKPLREAAGSTTRSYQAHAIADYQFANDMTLGAIAAWHSSKNSMISDEDGRDSLNIPNTAANIARGARTYANEQTLIDRYSKDWSVEARLTSSQTQRFRFVGGASYVHVDSITSWVTGDSITGLRLAPSATANALIGTPAVFGGAYYDILPKVTLSAEGRYQWDGVSSVPYVIVGTPFSFRAGTPLKNTFKSFSPRITLDYKPSDNTTVFALFSRGYRPGSFNSSFLTLPASQVAQVKAVINADLFVRQERLDNYEIGLKTRFWDNRAQVGVSAYRGKIYDLQQNTSVPTVDPSGVTTILGATANLGQLEFHGFEFEGALQATRELVVEGSFSWNHTRFEKGVCPQCANIAGFDNIVGRSLLYAPQIKGSLSLNYTRPISDTWNWFARADGIYEGKKFADQANFAWVKPRALMHVRTGIQSDAIRVEAYVTNLFDDKTLPSASNTSFDRLTQVGVLNSTIVSQLPDRRTWGIRSQYKF